MEFIKIALIFFITIVGFLITIRNIKNKKFKNVLVTIVSTLCLNVLSSYIYDNVKIVLPYLAEETIVTTSVENNDVNTDYEILTEPLSTKDNSKEESEETLFTENTYVPDTEETNEILNNIEDITAETSITGRITYEGQEDKYLYTASVSGTYHFSTDLSAGGSVKVSIDGKNGNNIDYDYDKLTINLEAGKTYILCIGYRNGVCDYTVNIGVPNEIKDITGKTSVSGNITYKNQEDRYLYTASVSGTYHFSTDLSAGGSVKVSIDGENGNNIDYDYDKLTIDLEAGKTYVLCIGYRNGTCDYTVNIGVPNEIKDITGKTSVSGNITYKNQEDKYLYTASVSGTYHFLTDLSAGGSVKVSIDGENGNNIDYDYDKLTIDLEAGKTYVLCIGYRNSFCSYDLFIEY